MPFRGDGCLRVAALEDQKPGMESESDEDLLIFMSMSGSDVTTAKEAWNVFYKRHCEYLFRSCRRVLYKFLSARYEYREIEDMAKELVEETMIKVFDGAETYRPNGSKDPDLMRLQIQAWLGKIAQNAVVDWLRTGNYESGVDGLNDIENTEDDTVDDAETPSSPLHDCVRKILDALLDEERMIVLASLQFYNPQKDSSRLSKEESRRLTQTLGCTQDSLRQKRRRVYRQLEKEIRSKCMGQDQE